MYDKIVNFIILYTKRYIYLCLKLKRTSTFYELIHFLKFKYKVEKCASINPKPTTCVTCTLPMFIVNSEHTCLNLKIKERERERERERESIKLLKHGMEPMS